MKRPEWNSKTEWAEYMGDYCNYTDDMEMYIDWLEKELDFYRRGGAQILDKDKDE